MNEESPSAHLLEQHVSMLRRGNRKLRRQPCFCRLGLTPEVIEHPSRVYQWLD